MKMGSVDVGLFLAGTGIVIALLAGWVLLLSWALPAIFGMDRNKVVSATVEAWAYGIVLAVLFLLAVGAWWVGPVR